MVGWKLNCSAGLVCQQTSVWNKIHKTHQTKGIFLDSTGNIWVWPVCTRCWGLSCIWTFSWRRMSDSALGWNANEWKQRHGLITDWSLTLQPPPPPQQDYTLFLCLLPFLWRCSDISHVGTKAVHVFAEPPYSFRIALDQASFPSACDHMRLKSHSAITNLVPLGPCVPLQHCLWISQRQLCTYTPKLWPWIQQLPPRWDPVFPLDPPATPLAAALDVLSGPRSACTDFVPGSFPWCTLYHTIMSHWPGPGSVTASHGSSTPFLHLNPSLLPLHPSLLPLDPSLQPLDHSLLPLDPSLEPLYLYPAAPGSLPVAPVFLPCSPWIPALQLLNPSLQLLDPSLQPLYPSPAAPGSLLCSSWIPPCNPWTPPCTPWICPCIPWIPPLQPLDPSLQPLDLTPTAPGSLPVPSGPSLQPPLLPLDPPSHLWPGPGSAGAASIRVHSALECAVSKSVTAAGRGHQRGFGPSGSDAPWIRSFGAAGMGEIRGNWADRGRFTLQGCGPCKLGEVWGKVRNGGKLWWLRSLPTGCVTHSRFGKHET